MTKEEKILRHFMKLQGVSDWGTPTCNLRLALALQGIQDSDGLLSLSGDDIKSLYILRGTIQESLRVFERAWAKIAAGCIRYVCHVHGKDVDLLKVNKEIMDHYRTNVYDPSNDKSWTIGYVEDEESASWQKSIRPATNDYPILRDAIFWQSWNRKFLTTIESHGLCNQIDSDYVPDNTEADKKKRAWLFKVLTDRILESAGKLLCEKYYTTHDTRALYKELSEYYSHSVAADVKLQKILTLLTSAVLDDSWNGTQEAFVAKFASEANLYNEITAKNRFTDPQLTKFLKNAVAPAKNLAGIYDSQSQVLTAMSRSIEDLTFQNYVSLLIESAQTHDMGVQKSSSRRNRRSANVMELYIEDKGEDKTHYEEVQTDETTLEANAHDSKGQSRSSGSKPRQVRMDRATWVSLTKTDQESWDKITDDGKMKILTYTKDKPSRESNEHQLIFDDDDEGHQAAGNQIDVGFHDLEIPKDEQACNGELACRKTEQLIHASLHKMLNPYDVDEDAMVPHVKYEVKHLLSQDVAPQHVSDSDGESEHIKDDEPHGNLKITANVHIQGDGDEEEDNGNEGNAFSANVFTNFNDYIDYLPSDSDEEVTFEDESAMDPREAEVNEGIQKAEKWIYEDEYISYFDFEMERFAKMQSQPPSTLATSSLPSEVVSSPVSQAHEPIPSMPHVEFDLHDSKPPLKPQSGIVSIIPTKEELRERASASLIKLVPHATKDIHAQGTTGHISNNMDLSKTSTASMIPCPPLSEHPDPSSLGDEFVSEGAPRVSRFRSLLTPEGKRIATQATIDSAKSVEKAFLGGTSAAIKGIRARAATAISALRTRSTQDQMDTPHGYPAIVLDTYVDTELAQQGSNADVVAQDNDGTGIIKDIEHNALATDTPRPDRSCEEPQGHVEVIAPSGDSPQCSPSSSASNSTPCSLFSISQEQKNDNIIRTYVEWMDNIFPSRWRLDDFKGQTPWTRMSKEEQLERAAHYILLYMHDPKPGELVRVCYTAQNRDPDASDIARDATAPLHADALQACPYSQNG
jgi:hypothetical protein